MQWFTTDQGASGVGYGNFMEIGPLDEELKPRATTWLAKADLLFVVSNPIQSQSMSHISPLIDEQERQWQQ